MHLTLTIVLFTVMCIANLVLHSSDLADDESLGISNGAERFGEVLKEYWASLIGVIIAGVFSIFVFGLCGFHTYLVMKSLTTQEMLKHTYDFLPRSPFSHGRTFTNWKKVVCWPQIPHTRLYYMLYLKHRHAEKFEKLRVDKGDEVLPEEMVEQSISIYNPPERASSTERPQLEFGAYMDHSMPEWQLMSSTGALNGRRRTIGRSTDVQDYKAKVSEAGGNINES